MKTELLTDAERLRHGDLGKAAAWEDAGSWLKTIAMERFASGLDEIAKELRLLAKLADANGVRIRCEVHDKEKG